MSVPNFSRNYWWDELSAAWRRARPMLTNAIAKTSNNLRVNTLIQVIGDLITLNQILTDYLALTTEQKLAVQEVGRVDTPDPDMDLLTLCSQAQVAITQIVALAQSIIPTHEGYLLERQWVSGVAHPVPRLINSTTMLDLRNALTALKASMYPEEE